MRCVSSNVFEKYSTGFFFPCLLVFPLAPHFKYNFSDYFHQGCVSLVRQTVSPCLSLEYQCNDRITCIHKSWVCDGEKDCPGGDDETAPNCQNVTCRPDQFQCKDRSCIPGHFYCSGKAECTDGSDELNCSKYSIFNTIYLHTLMLIVINNK